MAELTEKFDNLQEELSKDNINVVRERLFWKVSWLGDSHAKTQITMEEKSKEENWTKLNKNHESK